MKKLLKKYSKKLKILVTLTFIYIVAIFSLGYKIPWFDKHPDWQEFPNLSNKNIVIEKIENFELDYGHKFNEIPLSKNEISLFGFQSLNKENLKNIKSINFVVTKNNFIRSSIIDISFNWNSTGRRNDFPFEMYFYQRGIEYLEFSIGNQKGFFKAADRIRGSSYEKSFYQYNYPKTDKDTLFFRYWEHNYKAYIKKQ